MDENHQDTAGSKLRATDNKLWIPPLSTKDQKKLDRLRKKPFAQRMGLAGKTPFDFIQLLLIPLVIAGVGYWFSFTQTQSSLQSSQKQHDTDLQIAADQQRETTLETCLNDIKDLLLNKSLRASKPKDEVRVVARVDILAALRQLDGERKGLLMQFLSEAGLITGSRAGVIINPIIPIIDLSHADLRSAFLDSAELSDAFLSGAFLSGANLSYATLSHVHLISADLFGAFLSGAFLSGANLSYATLYHATLYHAELIEADLIEADLRGAYLKGARITEEQLKEARSLQGTTMPDGSKHP